METNMIDCKSILAIIPARAGSKGLPGKNNKFFCGKPLIAWTIEAALGSKYIDHVVISTDSNEIANVAGKLGVYPPFIRPPELASDEAKTIDVIKHAMKFYEREFSRAFDLIVLLEPTSPLRTADDIDGAIVSLVNNKNALAIVGVCKTESQHPAFLAKKDEQGYLIGYEDSAMRVLRRQEIDDVYFFEGSVYISHSNALLERDTFYHEKTLGYELPKWKSIEIDDLDDFIMAEALMSKKVLKL